jgi:hypothetical protein
MALAVWACAPATAYGGQSASLHVGLTPERLGGETTLSLGFQVNASAGAIPSPLTAIDLHMPRNLGIATSGLGVATCQVATLEAHGASACPANSRMGSGSALVRFQVGPELFTETARIAVVAGPEQDGHVRMLVSATGESPVAARILISTVLLAGQLQISVPLVESLPEGGDIAVVAVQASLGGNLVYHERSHGRTISYRPHGITLPASCPRGGFGFSATFSFLDGTQAQARTAVACPGGASRAPVARLSPSR